MADLNLSEARVGGGDCEVANAGQFTAEADGVPLDGRDHGLRQPPQRHDEIKEAGRFHAVMGLGGRLHIATRAERAAGGAEHHGACLLVGFGLLNRPRKAAAHRPVDRVQHQWPVQRDACEAVAGLVEHVLV